MKENTAAKPKKKKLLLIGAAILIVLVIIVTLTIGGGSNPVSIPVHIEPLTAADLYQTVSTNGTVQSETQKNIYTKLTSYPVQSVNVEVGDHVEAGDVLCQIDGKDLQDSIEQATLDLQKSQKSNSQSIASAQKSYNDAVSNLQNGQNSAILSAQSSVDNAKHTLDDAIQKLNDARANVEQKTDGTLVSAGARVDSARLSVTQAQENYDSLKAKIDKEEYTPIVTAKKNVESAQRALDQAKNLEYASDNPMQVGADGSTPRQRTKDAQKALEDAQDALELTRKEAQDQLNTAQKAIDTAENEYNSAWDAWKAAQSSTDSTLTALQSAVDAAQKNYDQALENLQAAQTAAQQGIDQAKQQLQSVQVTADLSSTQKRLETMQQQLADCTITAPVAGTVTAVYAKEGAAAAGNAGLLFVIEDTSALKIDAKVKEYDIGKVDEGMTVGITADATGEDQYEGKVSKIAPAAVKETSASGGTTSQFDIEVGVTSQENRLKIGMSAKLSIITAQKQGALAVRYEALALDAEGNNVVYVAEEQADGTFIAKSVPVQTGLETDLMVEISGEGVSEGMQIIAEAENLADGMLISVVK